jgi:hypothetical protein
MVVNYFWLADFNFKIRWEIGHKSVDSVSKFKWSKKFTFDVSRTSLCSSSGKI